MLSIMHANPIVDDSRKSKPEVIKFYNTLLKSLERCGWFNVKNIILSLCIEAMANGCLGKFVGCGGIECFGAKKLHFLISPEKTSYWTWSKCWQRGTRSSNQGNLSATIWANRVQKGENGTIVAAKNSLVQHVGHAVTICVQTIALPPSKSYPSAYVRSAGCKSDLFPLFYASCDGCSTI